MIVKRIMDIVIGSILLVLFSPVMAIVGVLIRKTDGPPVLFRQQRPGLNGKVFTMYKFRTMRNPNPEEDRWTTDEQRVTSTGQFLRKSSLDELPELVNVIKGDMSLVGPRPLLEEYLPKYSKHHARRHEVKPGVTGLAQVSGRRNLTLGQRLDLDVQYIETRSLRLDLTILVKTLTEPFRRGPAEEQTLESVDDVGFFS